MNIWIPKLKIVEAEFRAPVNRGVTGWFHAQVFNSAGALVREYKRKNLVTNGFFSATSNFHGYAAVGTGSPSFTASSTALASQTGSRASFASPVLGNADASKWYFYETADFGLGNLNANLTEFGVFTGSSGGNMTFCDLIRDSGGSPTTFPVTSDEQLRLTHGVEISVPTSNTSGSFTIGGGAGSGSHDFVMASTELASPNSVAVALSALIGGLAASLSSSVSSSTSRRAIRGATGAGTSNSGGSTAYAGSPVSMETSAGTYSGTVDRSTPGQVSVNTSWVLGLAHANHADGISGISFNSQSDSLSYPGTRIWIDPPIPKYAGSTQRILTLNFSATGAAA